MWTPYVLHNNQLTQEPLKISPHPRALPTHGSNSNALDERRKNSRTLTRVLEREIPDDERVVFLLPDSVIFWKSSLAQVNVVLEGRVQDSRE